MSLFIVCKDDKRKADKQNGGRLCITDDMKRYF